MHSLTEIISIFALGSITGWFIELFWKRYKYNKWVNSGLMKGPYLPVYGFGAVVLCLISSLTINLILKIIIFALSTTLLELVGGVFVLKFFKARLWDYSGKRFNYKGLICLEHSVYWVLLSVLFYYLVYPYLLGLIMFFEEYRSIPVFLLILFYVIFFSDLFLRITGRINRI